MFRRSLRGALTALAGSRIILWGLIALHKGTRRGSFCPEEVAMTTPRKRGTLFFFSFALTAALLPAGAAKERVNMVQPKTITITDKNKDGKVNLAVGDLLWVRLEGPLGEGHVWQITKNNKDRLKPLEKPPLDKLGKAPPSKVELHSFYLDAVSAGTVELELEYRKKGDKDAKAERKFKATVQIEAGDRQ
jgi:predicted secreted protein